VLYLSVFSVVQNVSIWGQASFAQQRSLWNAHVRSLNFYSTAQAYDGFGN
jgi:hypothetical protein